MRVALAGAINPPTKEVGPARAVERRETAWLPVSGHSWLDSKSDDHLSVDISSAPWSIADGGPRDGLRDLEPGLPNLDRADLPSGSSWLFFWRVLDEESLLELSSG